MTTERSEHSRTPREGGEGGRADEKQLRQQDAASRLAALELGRSCIVQAPAGAGKTELLTQRYLGLLATVTAPEQIVAITFTRKAAAEMRNRILKRLENAAGPEPARAHEKISWRLARAALEADRRQGWQLLDHPDRLRITTIDALCASIVRQMPYLSRFGAVPAVAEKPGRHYREAARLTLAAVEDSPAVAAALEYLDNDAGKLQQLIVAMLSRRDQWLQWLPHLGSLQAGADERLRAHLGEELASSLRRLVERDLALANALLADLLTPELLAALPDPARPLCAKAETLADWQTLADMLLTRKGTPRKSFGREIPPARKAALKTACSALSERPAAAAALHALAGCPVPGYAADDLATIETFVAVLIKAYGFLWGLFQAAGETDFVEVAARARQALGDPQEPSELALRLDYALRHLLVDEFQDTNNQQIGLLEQLTAGWTPGDGRTLFVVGDPMQSIYRFRKADVGLFLRAWQQGIGGVRLQPLTLYLNNRSVPEVVAWINNAFEDIFPAAADAERGRVPYSPAIATGAPHASGGVSIHPVIVGATAADDDTAGEEPADGDASEARQILAIIDATWEADRSREIAVLIRARSHLAPLIAELRRNRPALRYEAVEIESLSGRQPIQDLLALTRALCHRADRVNWLAVLRAPWCGLTLADLLAIAGPAGGSEDAGLPRTPQPTLWSLMQDAARIARLSADGQARLRHARLALQPLLDNPGRLPLRRQVEGAWRRLGGPQCLATPTDEEDVGAFFRLLDQLDATGRFDLDQLAADIAELYATPRTEPAQQASPPPGTLKFMTVHKAKGLEFDTVILPGLHRSTGRHDPQLLAWEATHDDMGQPHLVVAPYQHPGASAGASNGATIRAYIEALEKDRGEQEDRRVLYVAATRAVRALHLLGVTRAKRDEKTGQHELKPGGARSGTPLHVLWPAVAAHFERSLKEAKGARLDFLPQGQAPLSDFVPRLQRLRRDALPAPAAEVAATPRAEEIGAEEIGADAALYPAGAKLAPHIGTLVHRYLELIATQGVASWDAARIAALRPAFGKWLQQQGHGEAATRQGAARVAAALLNAVGDPQARWILQARGEHGACELALTRLEQGVPRNHIVDRSFVEDGVRWIIDYKTGTHAGGDVEAFIAARCREYAEQLERYAQLFRHEGLPIRKALYFADLNRFEILPD